MLNICYCILAYLHYISVFVKADSNAVKHEKSLKKFLEFDLFLEEKYCEEGSTVHSAAKRKKSLNWGNLSDHNTLPRHPPIPFFFLLLGGKNIEFVCIAYRNAENLKAIIIDSFDRFAIEMYYVMAFVFEVIRKVVGTSDVCNLVLN